MKFNKPYTYFWITASIILGLTLVIYQSDEALDINIHDTYFVISFSHLGKLFSFLFAFIGIVYFITKKIELYNFLTQTHILISVGCFILFISGQIYFSLTTLNKHPNFPFFDNLSNENSFFSFIFLLFAFAQLLFIINLVLSLIKLLFNRKN